MKDKAKGILIAALMIATIIAAMNGIDNPKPNTLAANITREIRKVTQ